MRREMDRRMVFEALLATFAIVVLIVVATTGYAP